MTWVKVQEVSADSHSGYSATATQTFGATPTEGNDMFAIGLSRPSNTSGAAPTHVLTSGGNTWTEIATAVTSNHRMSIFHRVAGASEATAATLTATHGGDTNFSYSLGLVEFSGPPVDVSSIAVLQQEANTSSSNTETVTTGILASDEPHLFLAAGSVRIDANNSFEILASTDGTSVLNLVPGNNNDLDTDRWGATFRWFRKQDTASETITFTASSGGTAQTIGLLVGVKAQSYNIIATDDFNRANGGLGANWTTMSGATAPQISGNAVVTGYNWTAAKWTADTFDDDQWAQITVSSPTFSVDGIASVSLRNNGTDAEYEFQWHQGNGGQYRIVEWPSDTVLAASAGSKGLTGSRTIRGEAVGTNLRMYVDGVEVLSTTDTTLTGGVVLFTAASCTATLDNFSAGDWSTAAVSHPLTASGLTTTTGSAAVNATRPLTASGSTTTTGSAAIDVVSPAGTVTFAFTEGVYAENNPTVTPTAPSGTGGILVAIIHRQNGGTVAWNTPGDWTLIDQNLDFSYNSVERYYTYATNPDRQVNYNYTDVGVHLYRVTGASGPPHAVYEEFWILGQSGAQTIPDVVAAPSGVAIASFNADGFGADQLPDSFSLGWTVDKNSSWSSTSGAGSASLHIDHTTTGTFDSGTATFNTASSCSVGVLIIPTSTNVIATDDFNRANEDLATSANWNSQGGTGATLDIISNAVQIPSSPNSAYSFWVAALDATANWVECDIDLTGTTGHYPSVVLSESNTTRANSYSFSPSGDGSWYLTRRVADSATDIASGSFSPPSGYFTTRLEWVDGVLTAYVDGVEIVSQADANVSPVYAGFGGYEGSSNYTTFDNFSAGDWSSGGPTSHPLTASGSTTTTGTAAVNVTRPITATGSTTTTGSAAIDIGAVSHPITASGSTTTTGAAAVNVTRPVAATGATTTTGTADIDALRPLAATGSTTTTGTAAISVEASVTTTGSTTTTGTAAIALKWDLVTTTFDDDRIDLTWNAQAGAVGYDIERGGSVIVFDHVTNSYSDTGLDPEVEYTYRVRAVV